MQLNGSQIFVEVLCEQGVETIFAMSCIRTPTESPMC